VVHVSVEGEGMVPVSVEGEGILHVTRVSKAGAITAEAGGTSYTIEVDFESLRSYLGNGLLQ
jgi:hypothetical protein